MQFDYYIYAYYEQYKAEPFYIGKGRGSRAESHLYRSNLRHNTALAKKLRSLIQPPRIEYLHQNLCEVVAFELEIQLIAFYGRRSDGGCLLNLTDGGDGRTGIIHSEITKQKLSDIAKVKMKGNQNGRGHVAITRRPIICTCCGTIVKRYDFVNQVKDDGYDTSNIIAVLKGRKALAYGLDWEYEDARIS